MSILENLKEEIFQSKLSSDLLRSQRGMLYQIHTCFKRMRSAHKEMFINEIMGLVEILRKER